MTLSVLVLLIIVCRPSLSMESAWFASLCIAKINFTYKLMIFQSGLLFEPPSDSKVAIGSFNSQHFFL